MIFNNNYYCRTHAVYCTLELKSFNILLNRDWAYMTYVAALFIYVAVIRVDKRQLVGGIGYEIIILLVGYDKYIASYVTLLYLNMTCLFFKLLNVSCTNITGNYPIDFPVSLINHADFEVYGVITLL